jgi:hypothetical protein
MFHAIPVSASVGISLVISVASITGSDRKQGLSTATYEAGLMEFLFPQN